MILVVRAIFVRVPFAGIGWHSFQLLKEWFILDFAHHLVDRLCKHSVYPLNKVLEVLPFCWSPSLFLFHVDELGALLFGQ